MKNLKGDVLVYTNPRGARFDTRTGRTFKEEWFRKTFNCHYAFGGRVQYDVDPVESYQDYCLWWYNKMFDTGFCNNIYWDDMFPSPNYKEVNTEAYVRSDGRVQPSVGLFNMRNLVKRTATYQLADKYMNT